MNEPDVTPADETSSPDHASTIDSPATGFRYTKPLLLLAILAVAVVLAMQFGQYIRLDYLATKEAQLREFQLEHPLLVYGVAFVVYVAVTGLSLPGAAALTLVYGWYFGFTPALVMISFASTSGATVAFLISRYLLRDSVQSRFGDRLATFNKHLEEEGAYYLFTLRLIPLVPFFVINLVMGLTPLKTKTYWWVSQVGMLPGTAVYVYAGSRVPNLTELAEHGASAVFTGSQLLQLGIAFAMLGLFPMIAKFVLGYASRGRAAKPEQP